MPEQKPTPGEAIHKKMKERGWTQEDLARIIGRYRPEITNLISGKRNVTPELAIALGTAFSNPPEYWMELEAARQLSFAREDPAEIRQRLRMYEIAPIKDMQKRGWISEAVEINVVEAELKQFYEVESLTQTPEFPIAAHKSTPMSELTIAQKAWCFRARQMARVLPVKRFSLGKMDRLRAELRKLAAYPKEVLNLPEVLTDHGIRFVVVEPLYGSKIDGATFWLDDESPVIAVSARYDRIDAFWFTVIHEFAHVNHGDSLSVDDALVGDDAVQAMVNRAEQERRADDYAAATLVPRAEMESFVRRVSPLYTKKRINQFANRIKMHPGIIVGQLQFRGEVGYGSYREMLVKVRSDVVQVALTDGWGKTIRPDVL